MPDCPDCQTSLETVRQRDGIYFLCQNCQGRAVTVPQVRRIAGERLTAELMRKIRNATSTGVRPCPHCRAFMRQFYLENPPIHLDACKACNMVWFDAQEFEALPECAIESVGEMQARAAEAVGMHRLEQLRERDTGEAPDEWWKIIPAFLGFPVERDADPWETTPLATWILAGVITLASVLAFFNLDAVVDTLGFVPTHALRYGGVTMLTSFFLHAGFVHLLGNMYFLMLFGGSVENKLGWKKFLLLIFAATIAGDCVHWLLQAGSDQPCIGASGGISAVLVFYAFQFPRARLGFLIFFFGWRPRWFYLPAWVALVFWLLLQVLGLFLQLNSASDVASTAHLGGAALGFFAWLWWKKSERPAVA